MKKTMLSVLLVFALIVSLIPAYAASSFDDVPETHWAHNAIELAKQDGVSVGVGNNNFAPTQTLTRGEFITMLVRAFYPDELAAKEAELEAMGLEPEWYAASAAVARSERITSNVTFESKFVDAVGYMMGTYVYNNTPNDMTQLAALMGQDIVREDMAIIAANIIQQKAENVPTNDEIYDKEYEMDLWDEFPDGISLTQMHLITTAYMMGVIRGVDANGTFAPYNTVTRAEAAQIYANVKNAINGVVNEVTTPDKNETNDTTPYLVAEAKDEDFSDYNSKDFINWDYVYVSMVEFRHARAKGIVFGYSDNTYRKNENATMSYLVAVLMRAFYAGELNGVAEGRNWLKPTVTLAYNKGFFKGTTYANMTLGEIMTAVETDTAPFATVATFVVNILNDKGVAQPSQAEKEEILVSINNDNDNSRLTDAQKNEAVWLVYNKLDSFYGMNTERNECWINYTNRSWQVLLMSRYDVYTLYTELNAVLGHLGDASKAPYGTSENSIIGTFNDVKVQMSEATHSDIEDYWSYLPAADQAKFDREATNAMVWTLRNREWLAENEVNDVLAGYFNYPCYDSTATSGWVAGGNAIRALSLGDFDVNGHSNGTGAYWFTVKKNLDYKYTDIFPTVFAPFTDDMSDADKILLICQEMYDRCSYGQYGMIEWNYWDTDMEMVGVCGDYAYAFRDACLAASVPCLVLYGPNHVYNAAYVDGEWYIVDPSAQAFLGRPDTDNSNHILIKDMNGWADESDLISMQIIGTLYDLAFTDKYNKK